jgi:hypothetical protein
MVRDALDCGASMGKPPFLLGIIVEEKVLLDFDGTWGIAPAGATKGHENKRSLRSPFGNLRRRCFWGYLRLNCGADEIGYTN